METIKEVQDHIQHMVLSKISAGQVVAMHWLTHEVLNRFDNIQGSDSGFYIICAKHYVSDQVKRAIAKFEPKANGEQQLVLDGFTHLQQAYPVERDAERVLVPVDLCSDEELERRALELEQMAQGCMAHAFEIRKYMAERIEAASA